jgi:hypothetical protein
MADTSDEIREDVADTLKSGQTVYDNAGVKMGLVDNIDSDTGWLTVQANPFSDKELYVPFSLITNIDARELYLSRSRDELRRDYANPPARETRVEKVRGQSVATTREASGYDGSRLVVNQANINELRDLLSEGYVVVTSDEVDLGTIKRYERTSGWMLIGKTATRPNDLIVPVMLVSRVDRQFAQVHLAVSMADLSRMLHLEPVDVVFTAPIPQ